jgi:hypothetical protein
MVTLLTEQEQNGQLPATTLNDGIVSSAFAPGGKLLASIDDNGYLRLWNMATGAPVTRPQPAWDIARFGGMGRRSSWMLAFSADGALLASTHPTGHAVHLRCSPQPRRHATCQ